MPGFPLASVFLTGQAEPVYIQRLPILLNGIFHCHFHIISVTDIIIPQIVTIVLFLFPASWRSVSFPMIFISFSTPFCSYPKRFFRPEWK